MGLWLSKIFLSFRRPRPLRSLPGGHRPVAFRRHSDDALPGRVHPAVPAHAVSPRPRLFHQRRAPLPCSFYIKPRRHYPHSQTSRFPLGVRPLVNWEDPSKKPVQPPRITPKFRRSTTVFIPPPARAFSLPSLPLKPVVKDVKLVPSGPTSQPCPQQMEVKTPEELPKVIAKNEEDREESNRHQDQNSLPSSDLPLTTKTEGVVTSPNGSPGPPGLNHPQDSLSGNAQLSPVSSSPEGQAGTSSYSPSGAVLPPLMPASEAAVPSDPAPCCSQLLEKSTQVLEKSTQVLEKSTQVLREDQPPSSPGLLTSCKEMDAEKPCGSNTALACARKRKRPRPPLWGDRGKQPPPPNRPLLADDKNLGTLEDTRGQGRKTQEDKAEALAACTAAQPAPSFSPPAWARADTLPPASQTGQGPAPITATVATHLSSQPTLDTEDVEMDTTSPHCASPPDSDTRFLPVYQIQYSVQHRSPADPPRDQQH